MTAPHGVPALAGGRNLRDEIAGYVRLAIFDGQLKPRAKVDQDEIAAALGVSRIPIREALVVLEREGLVVWEPRRGAYVAPLTEQDIRDHFAILGSLNALMAQRYVEAFGFDTLTRRHERSFQPGALRAEVLRTGSLSHRLAHEWDSMASSVPMSDDFGTRETPARYRREIRAAIAAHDLDRLRTAATALVVEHGEHVIAQLRRRGFWS